MGRAGTSAANARYITREPATEGNEKAVFTHNYPDYAKEGEGYKEQRDNIVAYARQQEEDELRRPRRGGGETQTHYRAVASFEGKIDTDKARTMGQEYLEERFPNARAVGVVHQDTNHTHIHYHIQARDSNDKKLRFQRDEWRNLDREWARIYAREFGRDQAREHLQKKLETQEWKRSRNGTNKPSPDRVKSVGRDIYEERERRNSGHEFIESRVDRDQRETTNGIDRAEKREGTSISRQSDSTPGKRAIDDLSNHSQRADRQFDRAESAARGALRETEGIREEFKELGSRDSEKVIERDKREFDR